MLQPKLAQMILFVCLPCLLVLVASVGTGNFNLFLNESETSRLLGVPGELYYARNGYVNDYALSFNLPIKTEITEIYFDWFNDHPTYLPETKMFYSLAISVSNLHAMYQPIASIPTNGTVPTKPAGFSISLLCTGLLSIEVDVKIQLNVSSTPTNLISLDIRRKKPCLRGLQQSRAISQQRLQPEPNAIGPTSVGESEAGLQKSQSIFYVGIGCSLAVVVIIAVLVLALYVSCTRSKNSRSGNSINDKELSDEPECLISSENGHSMILSAGPNTGTLGKWRSPRISTIDRNLPTEVLNLLSTIRIEPCRLSLKEIVIQGDYGRLYRGSLITGSSELEEKDVFVKTVTEERSENMKVEQMAREGCSFLGLQHENVHSIIAACVDSFGQTLLIYPFMDEGILKMYLHEKRQSTMLTIEQLMCIAIQLTAAISYLHRNDVIHGDIATRNCLIDSCQSVRLADNALSADIFPLDYDDREDDDLYSDHQIDHHTDQYTSSAIPTRWMAIESLSDSIMTTASDVWSFGITLWELVTFAQQPYPGLESSDLFSYLQQGYRLSQPTGCPKDLYAMMLQCWTPEVRNRPTISQLQSSLHNFGTSLVRSK